MNWGSLTGFTTLWLPFAVAQCRGRTLPWLRHRGPVRLLGAAGLALYGVVVANTVPRLAGAGPGTLAYSSYVAMALTGLYGVLLVIYAVKASAASRTGCA
ncbi:hypothetical protein [Streptomyces sp. MA25(2023)]|uniref:hypothetical protein n=1 Tax=Streptomyces sp. MA25(2023) TaxID=3055078 RepID=UPI0025B0FBE7|nr:hypothetical protein [Streptomyces sp. MA25(2023)]